MSYQVIFTDSLSHHGIKGQRWGIRRYRNEDGSLTEAGKKRYGKMSGEKIYKTLKKQVRQERAKRHGSINRWLATTDIGENSKKLIEENNRKWRELQSSEEWKKWEDKAERLTRNDKLWAESPEKYDEKWEKLMDQEPKRNWNTLEAFVVYRGTGKEYLNDYLNKGGKDLSIAYIKDLGYNEQVAKEFVDKMIKSNRTLGDV